MQTGARPLFVVWRTDDNFIAKHLGHDREICADKDRCENRNDEKIVGKESRFARQERV